MSRIAAFILAAGVLLTACRGDETRARTESDTRDSQVVSPPPPDTTSATFDATGVVKSITPNRRFVIIDHEDIPGLMDAMAMPFAVADTSLLRAIEAGQRVRFHIVRTGNDLVIHGIEASQE